MLELIKRLEELLRSAEVSKDPGIQMRGMGDVLCAMKDRTEFISREVGHGMPVVTTRDWVQHLLIRA